ncbi:MAG: transglycosylase family protein [Actinomycetota bacterium]|nr:transglycosylase family protein [Actinomycetota bacterium]
MFFQPRTWRAPALLVFLTAAVLASVLLQSASFSRVAGADAIADKRAEADRLTNELSAQAQRVIDADRATRAAEAGMADAQESLRQAENGVRVATQHQDEARSRLAGQAVDAYTHGGSISVLGKRLRASSDLVVYDTYLSLVAGMDRSAVEGLRATRQDLSARKALLATTVARAKDEAARIASEKMALQAAEDTQKANLNKVNGEVTTLVAAEQARRLAQAAAARRVPTLAIAATAGPRPTSATGPASAAPSPASAPPSSSNGDAWACIRQLESGNNYSDPGGGAYQFEDSTWQSLGYSGAAEDYPPDVQDAAARELQAREGWGPWPNTARMCGLL